MAEFCEVMRQAKRMCEMYESRCERCPFGQSDGCPFNFFMQHHTTFDFSGVERIVMDWAAKNPEPRHPTWREWQRQIAPEATDSIRPCAFMSMPERIEAYGKNPCCISCSDCLNRPIPAEIAEKLNIKPIGVDSDA